MKFALYVALFSLSVLAGCQAKSASEAKAPKQARQTAEDTVFVQLGPPDKLVKRFPVEPDPADSATDPSSCKKAGGEWADSYSFGELVLREPQEGAVRAAKMCWSKKPRKQLADGGKHCSGQADCVGNCVAEMQSNRTWSAPACQKYVDDDVCGAIYDGGKYYPIACAVP